MIYEIEFTDIALSDIERHKKILNKIDRLLNELRVNPTIGTGKPEKLKYYRIPTWSRRITNKHRLVYRVEAEKVTVFVLAFWGHYD